MSGPILGSDGTPLSGHPPASVAASWQEKRNSRQEELLVQRAQRLALLRTRPDLQAADRLRCAADFAHFVACWGWLKNPKAPPHLINAPAELWPRQIALISLIFELIREGIRELKTVILAVPKSREIGVTWILLMLHYWLQTFHAVDSILGSKKEEYVDRVGDMKTLFERLRYIHGRMPRHLRPRVDDRPRLFKNLDNRAAITGEAATESFAQGARCGLITIDEFNAVDRTAAAGMITGTTSVAPLVVLPFNPYDSAHKAAELVRDLPARYVFPMDWTADPFRPPDFFERQLATNGGTLTRREAERSYLAKFVSASGTIFEVNLDAITYDEDSPEWVAIRAAARGSWLQVGGWDFGSGPSALVCLYVLVELLDDPGAPGPFRLWIDCERVWYRTAHPRAGADVREDLEQYGGPRVHYGDPSGIITDASGHSWMTRLQGEGVPLFCLDAAFNTSTNQDWTIQHVQRLIDSGLLRVHRRCRAVREMFSNWAWDLPAGVSAEHVSRAIITPRKDGHSHPGQALLYAVDGAILQYRAILTGQDQEPEGYSGTGAEERVGDLMASFQGTFGMSWTG